ncbi:MAG: hypothetical protein ACTSU5_06880 [Promethearchaeota archaeon]
MIELQVFLVEGTGETKELKSEENDDKPIKELLDPGECYICVDDRARVVYLWKGENSRIRSKFIGAKKSQEVRGQVGLNYKVVPIDQGDEPPEFQEAIEQKTTTGFAKEIREEGEGPAFLKDIDTSTSKPSSSSGGSAPSASPPPPRSIGTPTYVSEDNTGPLYTGGSAPMVESQAPAADFQKILETLENLETPPGYEREMVIVGSQTYTIVEKVATFLGQKTVQREMEPIGSLPEGVFFAEQYAPRVLCENGKVLAIEFLKRVGGTEAPVEKAAPADKPKVLKEVVAGKSGEELTEAFGFRTQKG